MFCRFCGSELREGAKFCTRCGKQIVAPNPTPATAPTTEQQPAYTAPAAPVQPAPEVQYTPEPKVQPEPATPVADPAPKYEAPAAYTAPAYTAEPSVPADKKAKKVKKEGKKSKKGLVITLIILAILAVAAAAYFIFFGNKIEISDEAIAAIYEDTGIENAEDVIKIVSAKVMSTEYDSSMGVSIKEEHVRVKVETEFVEAEVCYVITYERYDGKWYLEGADEYYDEEDCEHGGIVITPKKNLTAKQVEADVREYFGDDDMICTDIVIPKKADNATQGIYVTLTANGEINGNNVIASVTAYYYIEPLNGWRLIYAAKNLSPDDGASDDGYAVDTLPSEEPMPADTEISVPDAEISTPDTEGEEPTMVYNFLQRVDGYWACYNYENDSWDVIRFYDGLMDDFTYAGHYWISEAVVHEVEQLDSDTVKVTISFYDTEPGDENTVPGQMVGYLILSSYDDFNETLIVEGEDWSLCYGYVGKTQEDLENLIYSNN